MSEPTGHSAHRAVRIAPKSFMAEIAESTERNAGLLATVITNVELNKREIEGNSKQLSYITARLDNIYTGLYNQGRRVEKMSDLLERAGWILGGLLVMMLLATVVSSLMYAL